MFRRISFAVLLFLAVLQCLAPLLHAHYSGASTAVGVHIHDLPGPDAGEGDLGPHFQSLSAYEAPSVGIENSLKDSGTVLSVLPAALFLWLLPAVVPARRFRQPPRLFRDACRLPHVLAPPLSLS
jgi:hypothetical protein